MSMPLQHDLTLLSHLQQNMWRLVFQSCDLRKIGADLLCCFAASYGWPGLCCIYVVQAVEIVLGLLLLLQLHSCSNLFRSAPL